MGGEPSAAVGHRRGRPVPSAATGRTRSRVPPGLVAGSAGTVRRSAVGHGPSDAGTGAVANRDR